MNARQKLFSTLLRCDQQKQQLSHMMTLILGLNKNDTYLMNVYQDFSHWCFVVIKNKPSNYTV